MDKIVLRKCFGCCGISIKISACIVALLHFTCDLLIFIEVVIHNYVSQHISPIPLSKKGQVFTYVIIIADRAAVIPLDVALIIGIFWEIPKYMKPWLYMVGFLNIFGIYVSLLFGYNCLYALIGVGVFSFLCYLWLIVFSCCRKFEYEIAANESVSSIGSRSSDIFHDETDAVATFKEFNSK